MERNLEDGSNENEDENSWSDWNDESIEIICLFCNYKNKEFICILRHMREEHDFDFEATVQDLSFYHKVTNYLLMFLILILLRLGRSIYRVLVLELRK